MYVVSEITGKKYSTVEECEREEKAVQQKAAQQKAEYKRREAAEEAWSDVVKAIENYIAAVDNIDPKLTPELKPLIELMRLL